MTVKSARSALVLFGITTVVLVAAASVSSTTVARPAVSGKPGISSQLQPHPPEHRLPIVDGASHPELFSDQRAVSMLLLMAAHPDAHAGRNYIRHIFNKKIEGDYQVLTPEVVEGIRVACVEYDTKLKALYRSSPGPFPINREPLTLEYQSKIIGLLGPTGAERLMTIVRARVKPHMRTFSKP